MPRKRSKRPAATSAAPVESIANSELIEPAGEILIIASKMKEAVRALGCLSHADLLEAVSEEVYEMLEVAAMRAKANKRTTIRPSDL